VQIDIQQQTKALEKQHGMAFANSVRSKDAHTSYRGISSVQAGNISKPMIFRFYQENWGSGTPFYILAEGTITSETPKQFYQFARKLLDSDDERPDFVFFNSPGGSLAAGLEMGKMIRRFGLNTLVGGKYKAIGKALHSQVTTVNNGVCYSACAYAFLGGVGRRVMESGSFGVHQFYGAQKDSEASAQITMTLLAEYLNAMGVGRELLTVASLTPSKQMGVLTVKQAQELNVDNSSPPRSEWKIEAASSGRIYAYTIQKQPLRNATTTFFLMKENNIYKGKILYKIKQMVRSSEELVSIFGSTENPSLKIDGQEFPLKTIGGWKTEQDGVFATDFLLDISTISAMSMSREMYFAAWFPNASRDVDPSVGFSTEGLQRAIAALSRQAQ
jgi:hypothetical protein